MAMIVLYPTYFRIFVSPYSSIFYGSNLLYPSGPFRFIIDRDLITNHVEDLMTEFISKAKLYQKTNYTLGPFFKSFNTNDLGAYSGQAALNSNRLKRL